MGKHYEEEYKEYVSKMVVEEGRKATDLAYELEIPYGTLTKWVQAYKKRNQHDGQREKYVTPKEHEKALSQKDKEIERLKEENAILKKAMHIFTQNPE